MRRITLALLVTGLLAGLARAQSYIVYTLETGGDNHTAAWEACTSPMPAFTSGVTDGTTSVLQGTDLTWAVRVSVGGIHQDPGGPGDGKPPLGAANLVFDLEVLDSAGIPVMFGAAPMACSTGIPGVGSPKVCKPIAAGFWSSINDGDTDGPRGGVSGIDLWANAAFTFSLYNTDVPPAQLQRLFDPAPDGPSFDYGWYPTANGRGGIPIDGSQPPRTDLTTASLNGKLAGFTVGYSAYDYAAHRPGVGMLWAGPAGSGTRGFGANTITNDASPSNPERPLFEGQINTSGLPVGTYYIKVIPSQADNTILHGDVVWDSTTPNYGGFSTFATKANNVVMVASQSALPNGVPFVVPCGCAPPPSILARRLFYNNSWWDGNNVGIDAVTGTKTDSAAIDTGGWLYSVMYEAKAPLMLGGGSSTFANYTGYTKGINGLIYDVTNAGTPRDPVVGDFTFHNIGKAGTILPGALVTPNGFGTIVISTAPRTVRAVITFADSQVKETWLQVDVGTGFGASAETHFWGNAAGDTGVGNTWPNILVGPPDELACRAHPRSILSLPVIQDPFDVNKTRLCDPSDQLYMRANNRVALNCVKMIVK